jgi:hypothetical protein
MPDSQFSAYIGVIDIALLPGFPVGSFLAGMICEIF